MQTLTPDDAMLVLNGLQRVGPVTLRRLLDAFANDPARVLSAPMHELRRVAGVGHELAQTIHGWESSFDLAAERQRLADSGLAFVTLRDKEFPPLLREIYDPPTGLYFRGPLRPREQTIAIVGTRHPSRYGRELARKWAAGLARRGWCVASGLARGIDTAAHEGALEADGPTVGVLGCGPDLMYPPENLELARKIAENGAVISEFKFGTRASKTTFPMRNRLLSGMSRAVVVIETAERGGSLITAKFAAEHGRIVCAAPGDIGRESASGCHRLIRDGATLVTSVEEILQELDYAPVQDELALADEAEPATVASRPPVPLEGDEATVAHALREAGRADLDSLADGLELPFPAISAALLMLELKGVVRKTPDGAFESRA
ncbi:MAG: DNA-processing protein DprA [Opitutales bacterium]